MKEKSYLRFSLHLLKGSLAALADLLLVDRTDPDGHLDRYYLLHRVVG